MAGVADLVFLLDATGSMGKCINRVKENINTFITTMTTPNDNGELTVRDWRARVVGYRDYDSDGDDKWFIDHPFTNDVAELRRQLEDVKASGGGDEPESLLDALHKLATGGESDVQASAPDPQKWRDRHEAVRVIVVFTDASSHPTMSYPGAAGQDVEAVINELAAHKIVLYLFAPEHDLYDQLSETPKSEYTPCGRVGEKSDASLGEVTSDPEKFTKLMIALAKSVSKSATVEC
ncbi:MAG: VWA domain-containing protein [Planctomycetes bacterium]|nr:VWA domain-containing protein [Planctomycetota bacterium]